ncbi:MAG TPA: zinc-binding dehydrogenase [archaeon]|nr:zinc-binding dehydrogenase [archaeon]
MKALRLTGIGEKYLKMCEVPVPQPGEGQVLCRVDAAMACASDTKMVDQGGRHSLLNGWDVEKYPVTPGHEASLTVVAAGEDLEARFPPGTRCGLQPAVPMGPLCHRERYNNNAEGMTKVAVGYSLQGTFAEYLLLTEEVISTGCLIPLPADDIPHFAVCLAEPFSCVVASQERHIHFSESAATARRPVSGIKEGGVTVVIGAGPMGIMHVDLALTRNPRAVIVSEIQQERKKLAGKRFAGRMNVIPVHPDELEETLREVSESRGADDVIIAAGSAKLQEYSLGLLAKDGVANFFGGTKAGASEITVDTRRIHYDRITMVGSSGSEPGHVAEVLALLKNRQIDPGPYISAVGGMDGALDLMREVRHQRLEGKGLIYPRKRGGLKLVQGWSAKREAEFLSRP